MKAFLARSRRLFYAGTLSLVVTLVVGFMAQRNGDLDLWAEGLSLNGFESYFCLFLVASPIIYFLLVLISSAYIRKKGQFAASHQSKPFVGTFLSCVWSDVLSPFRCIGGLCTAVAGKYPEMYPQEMIAKSKFVSIRRFVWMILILVFCIYGLTRINDFSALVSQIRSR